MNKSTKAERSKQLMSTLPGDDVRQVMWRFSDRYDLQMVVQSTREVARGLIANLVANGARNTHDWTPEKTVSSLLSTKPGSPRSSWTRPTAALSKGRKISPWR